MKKNAPSALDAVSENSKNGGHALKKRITFKQLELLLSFSFYSKNASCNSKTCPVKLLHKNFEMRVFLYVIRHHFYVIRLK